MSLIGTNIKNIRSKKNMTMKQLGKKCGLSETLIRDVESGKKVPNTNIVSSISKALGVHVDAIEPSYFSDYFSEDNDVKEQVSANQKQSYNNKQSKAIKKENTISDAFSKAIKKIPVVNKISIGKSIPFQGDIIDYKYEPVFQNKANNVGDMDFIYYVLQENSMIGSRMIKGDLCLVFLTSSILNNDIVLFTYNNKTLIRRYKSIDEGKLLLYPDNPEYDVIVTDSNKIDIIGKIVRVEFKI